MSGPPRSGYDTTAGPSNSHYGLGYGVQDFTQANHVDRSPLSASMANAAGYDADLRRSSFVESPSADDGAAIVRSPSAAGSRSGTLKKRSSVRRTGSLRRSSSKRSLKAGSLAGFGGVDSDQDYNSFAYTPVPTAGAPTEILANRFQAWRQLLKSLITYFREVQASYEARQKAILKVENTIANIAHPTIFMSQHGLGEATRILDEFHKKSVAEANKSRDIEAGVIAALTGLRSDLGQKIKEIKSLSGDFKNSVEKEKDATRKAVEQFQDALAHADRDDGSAQGKNDPFVVRLGVDRMIERQIDEENYLHRAYLNLESSGRELESIVVGEIQKAFNAFAGILKREGDDAYNTVDLLRSGPIALPKDAEWTQFVTNDNQFVDPSMPLRRIEDIRYPGKNHPAAAEVRSGMLERKSKYLKSYTPGWYVLSSTHLHEFKSADKIFSVPPVMSLYLPDQKLGSRSQADSSSHKFILKGKQSGGVHKGHNWVFRAETYDTMDAWYNDIQVLTEATGEQRNAYVRKHTRSISGVSDKALSSDGFEEDEADAVPFAADAAGMAVPRTLSERPARPQPGGRFPSDLRIPQSRDAVAALTVSTPSEDGDLAIANISSRQDSYGGENPYRLAGVSTVTGASSTYGAARDSLDDPGSPVTQFTATRTQTIESEPEIPQPQESVAQSYLEPQHTYQPPEPVSENVDHLPEDYQPQPYTTANQAAPQIYRPQPKAPSSAPRLEQASHTISTFSSQPQHTDWVAPAAIAGATGAALGAAAAEAHNYHHNENLNELPASPVPATQPTTNLESASVPPSQNIETALPETISAPEQPPTTTVVTFADPSPAQTSTDLGGNEREGARETGRIIPTLRHQSTTSVSALHLPGKYPNRE